MTYRHYGPLQLAKALAVLVEAEIAAGGGLDPTRSWQDMKRPPADPVSINRQLREIRDKLQAQIHDWHEPHHGKPNDMEANRQFLKDFGYVVPVGGFYRRASDVDDEIAKRARRDNSPGNPA